MTKNGAKETLPKSVEMLSILSRKGTHPNPNPNQSPPSPPLFTQDNNSNTPMGLVDANEAKVLVEDHGIVTESRVGSGYNLFLKDAPTTALSSISPPSPPLFTQDNNSNTPLGLVGANEAQVLFKEWKEAEKAKHSRFSLPSTHRSADGEPSRPIVVSTFEANLDGQTTHLLTSR